MSDNIPPPSDEWKNEAPWDDDSLAFFESQTDPLDAQISEQEKRNQLRFKKATGNLIVCSVYLLWVLLALGLIVWVWHYVTPCSFLSEAQLAKVQSTIFSGTLGALVSSLAKGYIGRSDGG